MERSKEIYLEFLKKLEGLTEEKVEEEKSQTQEEKDIHQQKREKLKEVTDSLCDLRIRIAEVEEERQQLGREYRRLVAQKRALTAELIREKIDKEESSKEESLRDSCLDSLATFIDSIFTIR